MNLKRLKAIITTGIVAGAMAFGTLTASAAVKPTFPDVQEGTWYYDYVTYAASRGYITGYKTGYFGPADNLTRGQFATILYRINGEPEAHYSGQFADVSDSAFYAKPIAWAAENGVMTGYNDGSHFGPNDNITREQIVTVLYRYAAKNGKDVTGGTKADAFPDADKVSGFAKDAVSYAVERNIISGDKGNLNPQGKASRAQIAAILQRYLSCDQTTKDFLMEIASYVKTNGEGTEEQDMAYALPNQTGDKKQQITVTYNKADNELKIYWGNLSSETSEVEGISWTYDLAEGKIKGRVVYARMVSSVVVVDGYLNSWDVSAMTKEPNLNFFVQLNISAETNVQVKANMNHALSEAVGLFGEWLEEEELGTLQDLGFNNYK